MVHCDSLLCGPRSATEVWERRGIVRMALFYKYSLQVPSFQLEEKGEKGRWEDGGVETLLYFRVLQLLAKTDSDSLEVRPRIKCPTQRKEQRAL